MMVLHRYPRVPMWVSVVLNVVTHGERCETIPVNFVTQSQFLPELPSNLWGHVL